MTTAARAAILEAPNAPFTTTDIELGEPGTHEVLVRLVASGLCHTDPNPVRTPQPSGASTVRSASGATLTRLRSSAIEYCANDDCPKKWPPIGAPSRLSSAESSARTPPMMLRGSHVEQYAGCPLVQFPHAPHEV